MCRGRVMANFRTPWKELKQVEARARTSRARKTVFGILQKG
jgi:hypothetical protein